MQWAPEAIRGDKGVVLAAIENDCYAFFYASPALKRDPDVIRASKQEALHWVHVDGEKLEHVMPHERGDREIVLAAVTQNGNALRFASVDLKADREVVLAAMAQNVSAFRFASPALQNDPRVIQRREAALRFGGRSALFPH